jgi:deoxycytidine triphosphate deaminase
MILNDKEILTLCLNNPDAPMIEPFTPESVSMTDGGAKILSRGLSSFGYDITLAEDIYVFYADQPFSNSTIVDPKRFSKEVMKKARIYKDMDNCRFVLIPPNSFILGYSNERLQMPEDVMAIVLTKSTIARVGGVCTATPLEPNWCFTGDTLVSLANGESISFIDMVKGHENGEEYFGYSMNTDGRVSIEKLMNPRKVKTNASLVSVKLDNDEVIRCTPDHEFMLRDHSYVEAKDLKRGMSLMPLAEARLAGILPFNHKVESVTILEEKEDVYCLEVPVTNNFALDAGVFVHNCGNITLEFANLTRYPFKMYIDEGCAQLVFFKGNRPNVTYSDRNNGQGGKYQDQGPEVVFAKV